MNFMQMMDYESCDYIEKQEIKRQILENIIKKSFDANRNIVDFNGFYSMSGLFNQKELSNMGIYEYLTGIDITPLFPGKKLNRKFRCLFIEGNTAWISIESNHYRYFTKPKIGNTISFDIIDIVKLYYEVGSDIEAIGILVKKMNIVDILAFWRNAQLRKYRDNIELLGNLNAFSISNPAMYKLIKKHRETLIEINRVGMNNLLGQDYSYNKESLFFVSASYLADRLKFSRAKATKVLNFLCLVGLINKVPHKKIPSKLMEESIKHAKGKKHVDIVNYYTVANMKNTLDKIEEMSLKILDSPVRYSNISQKNIIDSFGKKISKKIFHTKAL